MAPKFRDNDDEEVYHVNCFLKFFVAWPSVIFCTSLITACGLTGVALSAGAQEPYSAFSDFSAESVYQYFGFEVARLQWYILLEDTFG